MERRIIRAAHAYCAFPGAEQRFPSQESPRPALKGNGNLTIDWKTALQCRHGGVLPGHHPVHGCLLYMGILEKKGGWNQPPLRDLWRPRSSSVPPCSPWPQRVRLHRRPPFLRHPVLPLLINRFPRRRATRFSIASAQTRGGSGIKADNSFFADFPSPVKASGVFPLRGLIGINRY